MAEFKTDKNVTAEYVNDKLESFTSALFDTLSETEERLRNLEQNDQYYRDTIAVTANARNAGLE